MVNPHNSSLMGVEHVEIVCRNESSKTREVNVFYNYALELIYESPGDGTNNCGTNLLHC